MSMLAHIVRHPIKSIGYETLQSAPLTQGRVLPFDRQWALAHNAANLDGSWAPKRNFVRGAASPSLMAVGASLNEDNEEVTLTHPDAPAITVDPDQDSATLVDWVRPFWPETRPAPSHIVRLNDAAFTDVPDPFVALLSLTSLAELGKYMGQDLSIHRFRGNLWVDGWAPFAEMDLIGKTIRVGATELKIQEPITRCVATKANPETGQEDADTLSALNQHYNHQDFGVYATVEKSGTVSVNDPIEIL